MGSNGQGSWLGLFRVKVIGLLPADQKLCRNAVGVVEYITLRASFGAVY